MNTAPKSPLASRTVWGGVLAALTPVVSALLRWADAPEDVVTAAVGAVPVLGGAVAIWGRAVAVRPIRRRRRRVS